MTIRSTVKFTPDVLLSAPRRSPAVPNASGTQALCTVSTYSFQSHSKTKQICTLDISTGNPTTISTDAKASEPNWLSADDEIIWLKEGENGNTSLIVSELGTGAAGAAGEKRKTYTAGTIPGPISNLKLCRLVGDGEEGKGQDPEKVAIAVSGQINEDGTLFNPHDVAKGYSSAKIYDSLFVRHWDRYVTRQRTSIMYGVLQKQVPRVTERKGRWRLMGLTDALKGTGLESPIAPFGGSDHFDISPSGLCFVAKDPGLNPATHTKCNFYYIPLSSFMEVTPPEPKVVTVPGFEGAASSPVFSPDGKSAVFLQMRQDGYESDKNEIIMIVDIMAATSKSEIESQRRESAVAFELLDSSCSDDDRDNSKNEKENGEKRQVEWDRSPSAVAWSQDGTSLLVQAEDMGRGCLFLIPLQKGSLQVKRSTMPSKLTNSGYISDVKPAAANSNNLFISSTSLIDNSLFTILNPDEPSEVKTVSSNSGEGALFGLSRKQVDEIWWKGAKEHPVHAWVVKPSRFRKGEKYPLAYLIHGGPQGAWGDQWSTRWNPAVFAEQGYVVITPNPTGSTGYGQAFTDAIRGQWGGLPYEDLVKGFEYIKENLDYVDTSRSVALGASYGGYMINWMNGHPLGRSFRALVCHDGVFSMTSQLASDEQYFPTHDLCGPIWSNPDSWSQWDPSCFTRHWSTPTLVIHNELDYRLCISEGLAVFNVLQMRGVKSRFLTFPDENHWVLREENSRVWHREVLGWINEAVGIIPLPLCGDNSGRVSSSSSTSTPIPPATGGDIEEGGEGGEARAHGHLDVVRGLGRLGMS